MGLKKDDSSILLYFTRHITQFSTDRPIFDALLRSVLMKFLASFLIILGKLILFSDENYDKCQSKT